MAKQIMSGFASEDAINISVSVFVNMIRSDINIFSRLSTCCKMKSEKRKRSEIYSRFASL